MKKILLIASLASAWFSMNAQQNIAIVASGGKFEFNVPQFQDRATIGGINLQTREYTVYDQIEVESVQKVAVDNEFDGAIYLAAQDSVISYQFNNDYTGLDEVNRISFPAVKTLAVKNDFLIVGKWYGTGDYLVVYDAISMTEEYVSENITTEVRDILFLNDTLVAVSYNLKGQLQDCGGYQCALDSLGQVDIIDLNALETIETVNLGTSGTGKISLTLASNNHFLACSSDSSSLFYIGQDFDIEHALIQTEVTELVTDDPSYAHVYGKTVDEQIVRVNIGVGIETGIHFMTVGTDSIAQASTKTIYNSNQGFTQLYTDYDTFGKVILNDGKDTVNVDVSVESIAFGFYGPQGLSQSVSNKDFNESYFTTDINRLDIKDLYIYNLYGQLLIQESDASDFNDQYLVNGTYVLKAIRNNEPVSFKILKR